LTLTVPPDAPGRRRDYRGADCIGFDPDALIEILRIANEPICETRYGRPGDQSDGGSRS
jgi:hypothetical protein